MPAALFWQLLPCVAGGQMFIWLVTRTHRRCWQSTGLPDLLNLFATAQISLALVFSAYLLWRILAPALRLPPPITGFPLTIFVLNFVLTISLQGAMQLGARLAFEQSRPAAPAGLVRLLIIGAGNGAQAVLREINRMPERRYVVVGMLDDAPANQRLRLQGVPVLGTIDQLPLVCRRARVAEILITISTKQRRDMQRIVGLCHAARGDNQTGGPALRFRMVPSFTEMLAGIPAMQQVRDVNPNDLLGRSSVQLDLAAVGDMLRGRTVLVTGAGGSIGSELCRVISGFAPRELVLLDKAENGVFEIHRELRRNFPALQLSPEIGDVTDAVRVEQIFFHHRPAVVFHAAAHKHVPLAESNSGEAIRNNIMGTRTLADAAMAAGVRRFVMISTDKAVNPTSIMGATKRCAEIYIQALAGRSATRFTTVRFGNVLNSNGSVVPIFTQQIAAGGPVTVTHPEMRRYFMTIPEAAQLVLQAAALGNGGEIFLLDMGEPVRILDLARDLIVLCGLRPEIDIPIVFTGLRPGEKLFEELSITGEDMLPTPHPKIAVWKSATQPWARVMEMLDTLEPLAYCTDRATALAALCKIIPEMRPWQADGAANGPAPDSDQRPATPLGKFVTAPAGATAAA